MFNILRSNKGEIYYDIILPVMVASLSVGLILGLIYAFNVIPWFTHYVNVIKLH